MFNLLLAVLISAGATPPKAVHRLFDRAGVVDASHAQRIERKLETLQQNTSDLLIVYVRRKLPAGMTVEQIGEKLIRAIRPRPDGTVHGAILVVVADERKSWLEIGTGVADALPPERCEHITASVMDPWLQRGEYGGAIERGVEAIANAIADEAPVREIPRSPQPLSSRLSAPRVTSAIPLPGKPLHYVTDNAGVLDAKRAETLDKKLQDFERRTSDQVIVYVDRKLPDGTTLEEMSAQAIRQWGIGQKGKDNGVILFLFTNDRKMRIQVGYGLEGSLTDAKSKLITGTIIKPRLQAGDYTGAVEQGVSAILTAVSGESYQGTGTTVAEGNDDTAALIALCSILGLIVLFAVVLFVRTLRRSPREAFTGSATAWGDSSSSSSYGGGGDSGGGFSGGGGDGGGGGASDSW